MSKIPFVAIPVAALAAAYDLGDLAAVAWLWKHADAVRGPFPASSRWLQAETGLSARKVEALLRRLIASGAVVVVTPGNAVDPRVLECWKLRNAKRNAARDADRNAEEVDGEGNSDDHRNADRNAARNAKRNEEDNLQLPTYNSHPSEPSVEQSSTMSNEQKAWDILEAVRAELHQAIIGKGATGRAMLPKRKTAMARVLKTCRQVLAYHEERGADRVTVSAALELTARWMYLSANIRASGARSTGEPLTTMVNTSFHEYLELALQGADMPKPAPEDVEPTKAEQDADEAERVEAWELARQLYESGAAFCVDPGPLESFGRTDNVIRLEERG